MATPPPEVLAWAKQFKDPNALTNLESQGYKNLWFSRAGQYDQAHKGTYGNAQTRELLSSLDTAPLGFKPQISAGYADIGHSNGKGGEHVKGGVFDIGLSGRTSRDSQKLKELLDSQGVSYLEEGRGTGNWHLHVRGKGGAPKAAQQQSSSPAYPSSPRTAEFNIPEIPQGAKVVPVNIGMGLPSPQQAQAANAARTKELTPPSLQTPKAPPAQAPASEGMGKTPPAEVVEWARKLQANKPKTPGFLDAAGQYLQGAANQVGKGIQTSFNNRVDLAQNPDFKRGLLMMPQVQLNAGALSEAANLVNGVLQLPADIGNATGIGLKPGQKYAPLIPNIPTGGLEEITGLDPVLSTAGRAAPYVFGETGLAGAVGTTARGAKLLKTIDSSAKLRALSSAGVNAAEGFLAAPGEGGMNQRLINAGVGGVIGGGAQYGLDALTGKLKPLPEAAPNPQPVKTFNSQADIIRNLANLDNATKVREIGEQVQSPAALRPDEMTANPAELTQSFKERGAEVPGAQPKGNLDAQVVDAQGNPIQSPEGGAFKTPYEIALERTKTAEVPTPAPSSLLDAQGRPTNARELDAPTNTNTPEPKQSPDSPAAAISPGAREVGAPQILDANGQPIRGAGVTRELEIPGQPKPADAPLEVPSSGKPSNVRELPTGSTSAVDAPKTTEGTAPAAGQPNGNTIIRPSGGTVYTQGREASNVEQLAQALENQSQIVELEAAKKLLAEKKAAGMLSPEEFQKQTDVLNLFEEAGRTGKTFNAMRREIQEGEGTVSRELGKSEVKTREGLSPFAITVRSRKPATEVSNMVKRLGSAEAARDSLRQMAGKYGITPTTVGRTPKANAVKIAEQIAAHPKGRLEFSDIYLNAHNFKSGGVKTATDAPRGYPLRTIEGANIGTETASIPQGALNQNAIAAQFDALDKLRNSPDVTPEVKQIVTKVTDNTNASFKDIRKMRESVKKHLESFCNIWSMK